MTKPPLPKAPKSIFIMDFWSDHNRGDAAMQVALISMLRDRYPEAELTICVEYGTNQHDDILPELDHVLELVPESAVHGGIRHTAYPIGSASKMTKRQRAVAKLRNSAESVVALGLIKMLGVKAGMFFGSRRRAALEALAKADLVVWNGRNFRSRSEKAEFYDLWSLVYNPKVAHALKRPVVAIGASCWELLTDRGRKMTADTLGACHYVSAREDITFDYLGKIMTGEQAKVLARRPDLSFGYLKDHRGAVSCQFGEELTLAMTIVEWGESDKAAQDAYVKALSDAVIAICQQHKVKVRIVPQVPYGPQGYGTLLTQFKANVEGHVSGFEVIDRKLSLSELCEEYAACDLLIGTRMHSVIFSWCSGTPAIGIAYDSGAKWAILNDIGTGQFIFPIQTVTADQLTGAFEGIKALSEPEVMARIDTACRDVVANITDWSDPA